MPGEIKKRLADYPEVSFIENISFEQLQEKMFKDYQDKYREITGTEISLTQADPVRLMLYSCAMVIYQGYQFEDRAGKMGLLKYSTGDFLDALAALKRVNRNPAACAVTTLKFTLSAAVQSEIKVPKGIRVKAGDNLYFETTEEACIAPGSTEAEVPAVCQMEGVAGNGFLPGELKTLVDPLSYNLKVENVTVTSGGAERETDDELAERIYLAPSGYSTAGSADAYRYWVRSYSQMISDCLVKNKSPGEVDIYLMMKDGSVPETDFLMGLENYLSDNSVRPLTDHVVVQAPQVLEYEIEGVYYIRRSDCGMEAAIKERAEKAVHNFALWQKSAIGRDINPSYLIHLLVEAGVKWADIRKPVFTAVPDEAVAVAGGITLEYGGLQDD